MAQAVNVNRSMARRLTARLSAVALVATVAATACGGPSARPAAKPGEVVTIAGDGKKDSFIGMTVLADGTVFVGVNGKKQDIVRSFSRSGKRRDVYRDESPTFDALAYDPTRRRLFGAQGSAGDAVWEVVGRTKLREVVGNPDDHFQLANPAAITVDPDNGNLYIADTGHHRVLAVPKGDGNALEMTAFADLRGPTGLAWDTTDKALYVADDGRVLRVGFDGPATVVAGTGDEGFAGDDGPATTAQLGSRLGIAYDSTRRVLWIADTANHRLRCVNTTGTIRTVAGTGKAEESYDVDTPATRGPALQVAVPYARHVGIDDAGNVYVLGDADASIPRVVQMVVSPTC